jgi:hypothetical protein
MYKTLAAYHAAYAPLVQRAANVAHKAAKRHGTPQALRHAYLAQRKANGLANGKPNGCPVYSLAMAVTLAQLARSNAPLNRQRQKAKPKSPLPSLASLLAHVPSGQYSKRW